MREKNLRDKNNKITCDNKVDIGISTDIKTWKLKH